jgi:hypothetical protein
LILTILLNRSKHCIFRIKSLQICKKKRICDLSVVFNHVKFHRCNSYLLWPQTELYVLQKPKNDKNLEILHVNHSILVSTLGCHCGGPNFDSHLDLEFYCCYCYITIPPSGLKMNKPHKELFCNITYCFLLSKSLSISFQQKYSANSCNQLLCNIFFSFSYDKKAQKLFCYKN